MIGTILRQRYKIVKQLGAGGFCETYLKIISASSANNQERKDYEQNQY
jgi:uncharacterized DUF497 family protein